MQNSLSTDNSANWIPGWWPLHTNLLSLLFTGWLPTDNWTLSPTNQLLQVTSLYWTGLSKSKSKSKLKLFYDWRFTADQFILASSPMKPTTRCSLFQVNPCGNSLYVTSSLTRRWVYFLWMFGLSSSACIAHRACYWKFFPLHYTQALCQYRLCKTDHAYLIHLML
jgi:hypothetical protein